MGSPADGYKTLAGILSINTMMEKRLAAIEKALTGGDKKGLDVKAALGGGGSDKYGKEMLKNSNEQTKSLKNIEKLLGGKGAEKAVKGPEMKTKGLFGIVMAAKLYTEIGKEKADEFTQFIISFFDSFKNVDIDKAKAGAEALKAVSGSMIGIILKLIILSPLMKAAEKTAELFIVISTKINEALAKFDKQAVENANRAVKTLFLLAVSMIAIVGALVLVGMAVMAFGAEMAVGVLAIAGIAAVFYLIGKGAKEIDQGAKAMSYIGLSMIALAAGFYIFALGITEAGKIISGGTGSFLMGLIAGIGTIALLAFVYGIAGEFYKEISLGALAFAAVGVSLIVLSYGLEKYFGVVAKIFGMNQGDGGGSIGGALGGVFGGIVTSIGGIVLLLGVGVVFALAGLIELGIPVMIIAGAVAFAFIGLSLLVLSPALEKYFNTASKIMGTKSEKPDIGGKMGDLFGGVMTTVGGLSLLLFTGAVFALAGIASPLIFAGAAAFALAGVALISIADGLVYFDKVAGSTTISDNLKTSLTTVKDAILTFVTDDPKGGILGVLDTVVGGGLVGAVTGASKIAMGLATAIMIGPALTGIAAGIGAWADLQNMRSIIGYDKMGQPIFDSTKTVDVERALENITNYLPSIITPFVDLSTAANLGQQASVLSVLTGIQLSSSPFARGVSVAADIGLALSGIAKGVGAWGDLKTTPGIVGYDEKGQPIYDKTKTNITVALQNITDFLPQILTPFADLSNSAALGQESSLLSSLTGIQLSSSPFARGVSVALEMGRVLTEIGNGLGVFVNINQIPEITGYDDKGKPIYSGKTVDSTLAIKNVSQVLKDIVQVFADSASNLEDLEDVEGSSIGQMIGGILTAISSSIETFANPDKIKLIESYDDKGKAIYSKTEFVNLDSVITNMSSAITRIVGIFADDDLTDTLEDLDDAMGGNNSIGKFLSDFIKPMEMFSKVDTANKDKGGISGLAYSLSDVITYILNSLIAMGEDTYTAAKTSAMSLSDISKMLSGNFIDFVEDYAKINGEKFKSNAINVNVGMRVLSALNATDAKKRPFLAQFGDEMQRLSAIATPFSKFVKTFGEFAEHMGTFKENFSFMNPDGIMAFEKWTAAVEHLVLSAEKSGVSGGGLLNTIVEKANGLISSAFGSGGGGEGTDMKAAEKQAAIDKANKPPVEAKEQKPDMKEVVAAIKSLEKAIQGMAFPKNVIDGNTIRITESQ